MILWAATITGIIAILFYLVSIWSFDPRLVSRDPANDTPEARLKIRVNATLVGVAFSLATVLLVFV